MGILCDRSVGYNCQPEIRSYQHGMKERAYPGIPYANIERTLFNLLEKHGLRPRPNEWVEFVNAHIHGQYRGVPTIDT